MDLLRRAIFRPYRKGYHANVSFTLTVWDTYRLDNMGKSILHYRLTKAFDVCNSSGKACSDSCYAPNATCPKTRKRVTLFEGSDFACSPCHAIDSDEMIASLMGFLTLRPGDTDSEYFEGYTQDQLDYCSDHAESLGILVIDRYGEH